MRPREQAALPTEALWEKLRGRSLGLGSIKATVMSKLRSIECLEAQGSWHKPGPPLTKSQVAERWKAWKHKQTMNTRKAGDQHQHSVRVLRGLHHAKPSCGLFRLRPVLFAQPARDEALQSWLTDEGPDFATHRRLRPAHLSLVHKGQPVFSVCLPVNAQCRAHKGSSCSIARLKWWTQQKLRALCLAPC